MKRASGVAGKDRPIPALLKALRPHQWTKNLALFLGVFFGRRILEWDRVLHVVLLFAAFCALASSVYLVNDVLDREEDARHPQKRHRPIASGKVSVRAALLLSAVLMVLAFAIAFGIPVSAPGVLHRPAVLSLGAYVVVNASYNFWLKRVVIADVTCVAAGFLIRVVSGPAVALLEVSSWLVLCAFFGALFLALAKRRGELFTTEEGSRRKVLGQYDDRVVDALLMMAATATLLCYSIYTVSPDTVSKIGTRRLLYTIPFVFSGLGRYLLLVYRNHEGEDPASLLFTDRGMLASIGGWLLLCALVLFDGARTTAF